MPVTTLVRAVIVVASVAGAVHTVHAQSLGDLSKQEQERQKNIKDPAKVYTNKDLNAPPPVLADPAQPAPAAAPPAPAAAAADDKNKDAAKDKDKDKDAAVKDQKYWSERKKQLDVKLERDKVLADAMQSRINGLTTDFAARSDPAQRAQIERDRQRAVAELNSLQKAIKDDTKALTDFSEEARKASVPPGWIR